MRVKQQKWNYLHHKSKNWDYFYYFISGNLFISNISIFLNYEHKILESQLGKKGEKKKIQNVANLSNIYVKMINNIIKKTFLLLSQTKKSNKNTNVSFLLFLVLFCCWDDIHNHSKMLKYLFLHPNKVQISCFNYFNSFYLMIFIVGYFVIWRHKNAFSVI